MNLNLKIIIAFYILGLSGCVSAEDTFFQISEEDKYKCDKAQYGNLELKNFDFSNRNKNTYLFNCVLQVVVPAYNESSQSVQTRLNKKKKLASIFLATDINVNYKENDGTTLLMSVILSSLNPSWKIMAVKQLLSKGASKNIKNKYGKTALDFAKLKKNKEIISLLSNN